VPSEAFDLGLERGRLVIRKLQHQGNIRQHLDHIRAFSSTFLYLPLPFLTRIVKVPPRRLPRLLTSYQPGHCTHHDGHVSTVFTSWGNVGTRRHTARTSNGTRTPWQSRHAGRTTWDVANAHDGWAWTSSGQSGWRNDARHGSRNKCTCHGPSGS